VQGRDRPGAWVQLEPIGTARPELLMRHGRLAAKSAAKAPYDSGRRCTAIAAAGSALALRPAAVRKLVNGGSRLRSGVPPRCPRATVKQPGCGSVTAGSLSCRGHGVACRCRRLRQRSVVSCRVKCRRSVRSASSSVPAHPARTHSALVSPGTASSWAW
jgi:hypothetical protein